MRKRKKRAQLCRSAKIVVAQKMRAIMRKRKKGVQKYRSAKMERKNAEAQKGAQLCGNTKKGAQ